MEGSRAADALLTADMIYIFTALYCEAHIFIKRFGLKKTAESTRFAHFANEVKGIRLTVSGAGEIAAASAVSSICTRYQPKKGDVLLNVGICAGAAARGSMFLIHKLTEQATGKTFYPDILYRHSFQEAGLTTGMDQTSDSVRLYDMEAAAVYQAGAYFFGPHQMVFLKIVSDDGDARGITAKQAESLLEHNGDDIFAFLEFLLSAAQEIRPQDAGFMEHEKLREEAWIGRLCRDMFCTKTMENTLRRYIRYLSLTGADCHAAVQELYAQNRLPCRNKKEGKKCLEQLQRKIWKPE